MSPEDHLRLLIEDEEWADKFMSKYVLTDGRLSTQCLEWQGGLDKAGYGRIHVRSPIRRVETSLLIVLLMQFRQKRYFLQRTTYCTSAITGYVADDLTSK